MIGWNINLRVGKFASKNAVLIRFTRAYFSNDLGDAYISTYSDTFEVFTEIIEKVHSLKHRVCQI